MCSKLEFCQEELEACKKELEYYQNLSNTYRESLENAQKKLHSQSDYSDIKYNLETLSEKRLFWECSIFGWIIATLFFSLLFDIFSNSGIPVLQNVASTYDKSLGSVMQYYPLNFLFTPFIKYYFMHKNKK